MILTLLEAPEQRNLFLVLRTISERFFFSSTIGGLALPFPARRYWVHEGMAAEVHLCDTVLACLRGRGAGRFRVVGKPGIHKLVRRTASE